MRTQFTEPLDILSVETVPGCGMIVHFSDGTTAYYPSEELALLRPYRAHPDQRAH